MFYILGPKKNFKIEKIQGNVKLIPDRGTLPVQVNISRKDGNQLQWNPFSFVVKIDQQEIPLNGILIQSRWDVSFYNLPKDQDPRQSEAWKEKNPVEKISIDKIDFAWQASAPGPKINADYFAIVATTQMDLPAGKYQIETISDDGVRVWINEKKIIDNWTWHGATKDTAIVEIPKGRHSFKIEYFEIDGYAQLQFKIIPVP
jgi:hypothetical protein